MVDQKRLRQSHWNIDPKASARERPSASKQVLRLSYVSQQARRALIDLFTLAGQVKAACRAMKEARAEPLFQGIDGVGDARARHAPRLSGPREAAVIDHRNEDSELLHHVHATTIVSKWHNNQVQKAGLIPNNLRRYLPDTTTRLPRWSTGGPMMSAMTETIPVATGLEAMHQPHVGFARVFRPGRLTFGFIAPLESYPDQPAPTMRDHLALARKADDAGFSAIWLRDVPFAFSAKSTSVAFRCVWNASSRVGVGTMGSSTGRRSATLSVSVAFYSRG